ncbi:MAG: hypothetical protein BM563_07790 [Bacteroidetes bacterium MedPE-SWsnd-G1]|nr:MAG: hypothetical protein BM563_07790 [Bacteroidetes bacterium MedPE-SWsnd-G1]
MQKLLLFLLFLGPICWSQDVIDFENEDYYFIKRSHHLKINIENDELKIANEVYEKAKYNSSNALMFASEFIHFDGFTTIDNLEAFTENPVTKSKIEVDHFETKDQFGGSVFFSDQQSINFIFPAVGKGAETTMSYTENIKDPHFLGAFRFGTYVPTKEATYTIEVPKGVEIGFKSFNLDAISIEFEKKELKKSTVYTWSAKNIGQFRKESGSLSVLNYLPHIIPYIKSYKIKRKTTKVLGGLPDLYSWYASLVEQVENGDLTDVYAIANSITENLNSDAEKAEAIFNWVQQNITYVAFEDGLGGFIPRGGENVYEKKYGDCKDMANLLYLMLNHVGIEAYHTWIGTRDRPYSYNEVPTPIVDNHMITIALINGEIIFLDATDSYVPYGMPSSFTQGKEALVGKSKDNYTIVVVPIQEKEKSTTKVETSIQIENGVVQASSKRSLTGYDLIDFIVDVKRNKDDKSPSEFLSSKFIIGNNKATYSNIDLKDTAVNNSYTTSYDVEIENYVRSIGSKLIINPNLEKPLSNDKIDLETQKFGKEFKHKLKRKYITTITIPEGYELKSIPKNNANEQEKYGYSFQYSFEGNKLKVTQQIYINTIALQNEEFEEYNTFIKNLLKVYKKSILLEKK